MRFSILSLFPELVANFAQASISGRALEKGLFDLELIQIRDFAMNAYGKVDDAPYGGGYGMLLMAEPLWQAWHTAKTRHQGAAAEKAKSAVPSKTAKEINPTGAPKERSIYLSPRGERFSQGKAEELVQSEHIILICGHYEGVDQRFLDEIEAEELSLGDFVLTGGEIAAAAVLDACCRLLPGVLPDESVWKRESHACGLLEGSQYTRPSEWRGRNVPEVLLSGHQARIEAFQHHESLRETFRRRPDLLENKLLDREEWLALIQLSSPESNAGGRIDDPAQALL